MNIAVLRHLVIVTCLTAWCARAQPNNIPIPSSLPSTTNYVMVLVTNWYDPEPGLRMVNGQVYNPAYAQIWKTVVIPMGAAAVNATFNGTVQPIDLTFEWGPTQGREHQTVIINNFPYNPRDFQHDRDNPYSHVVTAHEFTLRVLPIDIQTNWTPLGRMWIGQRTYDYGVPYTGKIPVATWERVPAEEATKKPAAVIRVPKHTATMPLKSYISGSFSDRLEAIQGIDAARRRDEFLLRLARDAANQDDLPITEQAVGDITDPNLHDGAAQTAAVILAQAGKARDAYVVVNMITNPGRRQMALQELHQQNQ